MLFPTLYKTIKRSKPLTISTNDTYPTPVFLSSKYNAENKLSTKVYPAPTYSILFQEASIIGLVSMSQIIRHQCFNNFIKAVGANLFAVFTGKTDQFMKNIIFPLSIGKHRKHLSFTRVSGVSLKVIDSFAHHFQTSLAPEMTPDKSKILRNCRHLGFCRTHDS